MIDTPVVDVDAPTLTPPIGDRDHVVGPVSAPVTVVEYGDYECPYCGMAHPIVKELRRRMGNQIRFAFRHFPLSRVHPHAERAAEAAEAAGAQGPPRFWQMHDMLYEHQDALEDEDLLVYAAEIGLDMDRFVADLESGRHARKVREDFISGVRSGVNGTPTFFINGRRHQGSYDLATLMAAVSAAAMHVRR
ncbi:MAG TPA: thioredoxin domain-containing protein [Chloroflexota bacterium]|jgi:protein-disulfide isomerase|nr:thioredoxin domain-containing protein [Chloroflexota bacterium]